MEASPTGRLLLRPFTMDDIEWVYEVSQDPALQQFVQVPSPYLIEHARFFVEHLAIEQGETGQRAEFVVQDAETAERLGRVGLGMRGDSTAEVGYWTAPAARGRPRGAVAEAACASR